MPIPLIPIAVVGAVSLAAGAIAVAQRQRAKKKLEGKNVAVIGGRRVGKTALLQYLEQETLPDPSTSPLADKHGSKFELEIDGATVAFTVSRDVPGDQDLGYTDWRKAVEDAHYVWYLFRADRIGMPESGDARLVAKHLKLLTHWLQSSKTNATVILVGTHADLHPTFPGDLAQIIDEVRGLEPIKVASLKIGARVIVGSLHTPEDAKKLRNGLRGKL